MPRKRATRAQTAHAKPKLDSCGDELTQEMTAAEKKMKLDNLIKDFDVNVESIRKMYEEELEALESKIDKHFNNMRCKLSPMELQMTVEDYIAFQQSEEGKKKNTEAVSISRPTLELASMQQSHNALSKYKSRQMIETIPEEGGSGGQQTTKKRKRQRGARNKAPDVSVNPEPSSSDVANNFVTPAMQRNMAATGWGATPLITPKFDPRLPITPANLRKVKPGEVAMSLAGSPLSVENSNRSMTVVEQNGTMVLQKGDNIEIDIAEHANIESLMSTLKEIMNKSKDT